MSKYKVKEAVVYRRLDDELVVVQSDTGAIHFFSPDTESVFDAFSEPLSVEEFIRTYKVPQAKEEAEFLTSFVETLVNQEILEVAPSEATGAKQKSPALAPPYTRPAYLRTSRKNLDQIRISLNTASILG